MQHLSLSRLRLLTISLRSLVVILCSSAMIACSKDSDDSQEPGGNPRDIASVVPASSIRTAADKGFKIYPGTQPPSVEGSYKISPLIFNYDNFTQPGAGIPVGYNFGDIEMKISAQQDDQSVKIEFKKFLPGVELKQPFITGSGNDFSICFQVNIAGGSSALFNFPFAYVVSGTLDGNKIKGLRIADFGLKTTADTQGNSVEGNVTLYSDGDGSSEKLP